MARDHFTAQIDGEKYVPELGADVLGSIVEAGDAKKWKVDCFQLKGEWDAILKPRSARLYQPGDEDVFWIYWLKPGNKLLLSDADFGRLPISDRMRPRYIQAIRTVLHLINEPDDALSIPANHFSEAKGMFNRCVRRDQWDWLTVYTFLGRPSVSELQRIASCLGEIGKAIRQRAIKDIGLCSRLCLKTPV